MDKIVPFSFCDIQIHDTQKYPNYTISGYFLLNY